MLLPLFQTLPVLIYQPKVCICVTNQIITLDCLYSKNNESYLPNVQVLPVMMHPSLIMEPSKNTKWIMIKWLLFPLIPKSLTPVMKVTISVVILS